MLAILVAVSIQADATWQNGTGGEWHDPGNWSAGVAPTIDVPALFGIVSTYAVDVTGVAHAQHVGVSAGNVTFRLDGGGIVTDQLYATTCLQGLPASLRLSGGSVDLGILGWAACGGRSPQITVDSGCTVTASRNGVMLMTGDGHTSGALTVAGDATSVNLRLMSADSANVLVSDGATLRLSEDALLYGNLNNSIEIHGGGSTFECRDAIVGPAGLIFAPNGMPTLKVSGGGSATMSGRLVVGSSGSYGASGLLWVEAGRVRADEFVQSSKGFSLFVVGEGPSQLDASTAVLDGRLRVVPAADYLPGAFDRIKLASWEVANGSFLEEIVSGIPTGMYLVPDVGPNGIDAVATISGDANLDGKVSGADFTLWADGFGMISPRWKNGDFDDDGYVTGADFTRWADNFGRDCNPLPIPEPTGFALATTALAVLSHLASALRKPQV